MQFVNFMYLLIHENYYFYCEISLLGVNQINYKFIARIFNNKIIITKDINLYDKNLLIFYFIL